MKEIQDIVRSFEATQRAGTQTALATVVHVEGSSYRRPGARMLVTEDGHLTGAISGGCLEGDALRKARLVMAQQKSLLVTYDTMDDDDSKLGVGLGCNGIIHILIEPIHSDSPDNPIQKLKQVLQNRQEAVLVTLFNLADRHAPQPGTCLILTDRGKAFQQLPGNLEEIILKDASLALAQKQSQVRNYGSDEKLSAFIEFLPPVVSLVVVGAGNDVVPLVQMAKVLGWGVTVIDGRANYATSERFPLADKVVVSKATNILDHVNIDSQTAFGLITHNYNYDLAVLQQLITQPLPFIGTLGPRKKLDRMLEEMTSGGLVINPEMLQKVYGPIGLDIGAETSEEIALAILAEIKAVLNKRNGTSLRNRIDTIHPRHPLTQLPINFLQTKELS